jgi:hypothetical protein
MRQDVTAVGAVSKYSVASTVCRLSQAVLTDIATPTLIQLRLWAPVSASTLGLYLYISPDIRYTTSARSFHSRAKTLRLNFYMRFAKISLARSACMYDSTLVITDYVSVVSRTPDHVNVTGDRVIPIWRRCSRISFYSRSLFLFIFPKSNECFGFIDLGLTIMKSMLTPFHGERCLNANYATQHNLLTRNNKYVSKHSTAIFVDFELHCIAALNAVRFWMFETAH